MLRGVAEEGWGEGGGMGGIIINFWVSSFPPSETLLLDFIDHMRLSFILYGAELDIMNRI